MNSHSSDKATGRGAAPLAEEEELEFGEPISEVETSEPAPKKIAAMRGKFGGGAPARPQPDNPSDGQVMLATAKYLKRDPEPELRRAQQKRESEHAATGRGLEGNVFNSGVIGGVVAMLVAVVWFIGGLMNDVLFFYPPILFVIGLGAFFKGLMKSE